MIAAVDTHAHIHFDQFAGEVDLVLHRAQEAGITKIITVGVDTADSRRAAQMAAVYGPVWAAVGIHPHEAGEAEQGITYIRDLAGRRKVVAIGECGLDFYKSQTSVEQQEQALRLQIELALELGLPVIFHVREAFKAFFEILRDYSDVSGVVHSFTGTPSEADEVLSQGLHLAANGIVTFTKDEGLPALLRQVPADRLLLETDCPFLSPVPARGKRNEPARVEDIAIFLAELRDEPIGELIEATTNNAERLFNLQ